MAWLAVDEDGREFIYNYMPERATTINTTKGVWLVGEDDSYIELPAGSIQKLLGYKLTWKDEAIEIA